MLSVCCRSRSFGSLPGDDRVVSGVNLTDLSLLTMFVVAVVPLVPTEAVLTSLAVLTATSHGDPVSLLVVSTLGCCASDHILYGFGRFGGARVLDRVSRRPSATAVVGWVSRNINRWGIPILIAGRWLPGGGTIGAVLAGTLRWRLARFSPTSLIGSTLWSGYVILLGYLGGTVAGDPVTGMIVSLGVAALLGATTSVVVQRNHRRRTVAAVATPTVVEAGM
jgi:membrane-associated protein